MKLGFMTRLVLCFSQERKKIFLGGGGYSFKGQYVNTVPQKKKKN